MLVSFKGDQVEIKNSQREFMNRYRDYDEENEKIFMKNVDVKVDQFSTEFEKNLRKLPSNIKFIKKLIYFELLPKIDKIIEDLDQIKNTPNYDDKLINIKPYNVTKSKFITCFDLFETNNIKNMKSNKIIYGSLNGSVAIYDIELQRLVCEKSLGKNRIDIISTSTVKYFDSYISRIAVVLRGDTNVNILSYNHSFSMINLESVINLKDEIQTDPNIKLSSLVSSIIFSKDSYYISLVDYEGGVRIYKFNEPAVSKDILIGQSQQGAGHKKDSSLSLISFQPGKVEAAAKNQISSILINNISSNSNTRTTNIPNLLNYIKYKEPDNFTILPKKEESSAIPIKDQNKDKKYNTNSVSNNKNNPAKGNNKNQIEKNVSVLVEENSYNIPSLFNESCDISILQKFCKNLPFVYFIQKKMIFEEKGNGGFSSSLVTVGVYIGFYGTKSLKFISLHPYLTDNMKNIFKVVKTKGGGSMSAEESLSLNSSLLKKEKEFISFIKSKLENINLNYNMNINNYPNLGSVQLPSITKDKNPKPETIYKSENSLELTKSELNFTTLYTITCIVAQKIYNNYNNLIAIGMSEGSILVWDSQLHIDKYLFQEKRGEITSLSIDENYLTSGTLDGIINIYDLLKGDLIYRNYHSSYKNYPIKNVNIINKIDPSGISFYITSNGY